MKINACIHINGQLVHEFVGCIQHTVWCVQRLLVSTHTYMCVSTLANSRHTVLLYRRILYTVWWCVQRQGI